MKIKLMLDTKKFSKKPNGYETGGVQKRISQNEIDIKELAYGLCNGMTCKPALLNGTKSIDWIQQQVFMLDFDHDTTIDEELNNCKEFNINPVFGYTSFSHSEMEHHFRLAFVTDELITDIEKRNKLQITLIRTFTKSDKVTYDPTRIFYGGCGKIPLIEDYEVRINADDIIDRFYKDEYNVTNPIKKKLSDCKNIEIKKQKPVISSNYMEHINAIKSLDVEKIRNLIGGIKEIHIFKSDKDLYEFINHIDLGEYIGIGADTVNCILPDHEDNTPSAHIYYTDDGTPLYKCFGCNSARTITTLTEELAKCTRREAVEFIKNVYNIQLVQSEWTIEQKQLLIDCANYLDTTDFKETFPQLDKIIRTRKLHIQKMLLHFTQYVNEDIQIDGKPLFFASYNTLMDICDVKKDNRTRFSQSITLFTLLNMLDKIELDNIPVDELNKAKHISAKYGFKKVTNFYQFAEYGFIQFSNSEKMANTLLNNNFTLKGLSREYILRTFGIEMANKVYPQYKYENSIGTSEKSNNNTIKLSKKVLNTIEEKGYILEKDIRGKGQTELQWKRSIQEILDTYNLIKVKASNDNKKKYDIPNNIPYQCSVICKNI